MSSWRLHPHMCCPHPSYKGAWKCGAIKEGWIYSEDGACVLRRRAETVWLLSACEVAAEAEPPLLWRGAN